MGEKQDNLAPCSDESKRCLFAPRSMVVIGASPTRPTFGTRVLRHLIEFGYSGRLQVIHSSASEILGVPAVSGFDELSELPDCICIAVGADQVLSVLQDAGSRGIRGAVIYASGFSETDEIGINRQIAMVEIARRFDMAVCGPNCLGFINFHGRVAAYSAGVTTEFMVGDVSVISQSGLACIALTSSLRYGLSYAISVGNSAVMDISECLEFLVKDPHTKVALVFAETIARPDRFQQAVQHMRLAGKPVVVLKVGRSQKGAAATAAHTGSLAGSAAAHRAFFERVGVIQVNNFDEAIEMCALLRQSISPLTRGGLGILNISGGEVALTCDVSEAVGLELPGLTQSTVSALEKVLPDFSRPSNPLDATGVAVYDMEMFKKCLSILAGDPHIAAVAVTIDSPPGLTSRQAETFSRMAAAVASVAPGIPKPILCYSNIGGLHDAVYGPLERAGIPMLQGTTESLGAIAAWLQWHQSEPDSVVLSPPMEWPLQEWVERLKTGRPLTERESKRFLVDHGIPVTREVFALSELEALQAAEEIGYPVVLKIESADIPHKSDVGGVALNLTNPEEVRLAYLDVLASCKSKLPGAQLDGVVIQEMIDGGNELIAGFCDNPPLGSTVLVGAGGVLAEWIQDTSLGFAPLRANEAQKMISSTKVSKLLSGYRGSLPSDIDPLACVLEKLSHIAVSYREYISAIDINPIAVLPVGKGVRALDALVIPK